MPLSTDEPSDEDLLVRALSDPEAFAVFYRRHAVVLERWFLAQVGNPSDATELTAECFAQALLSLRRFKKRSDRGATAWLYGIGRNLIRNHFRTKKVASRARARLGMSLRVDEGDEEAAISRVDAHLLRTDLAAALDGLSPVLRETVTLRVMEECSYDDIARRLGCTPATARVRFARGISALTNAMTGARHD